MVSADLLDAQLPRTFNSQKAVSAKHSETSNVCLRAGGMGNSELVFNGYGVSFWEDENVLEADRGDGSTTLNVENATELYALQ